MEASKTNNRSERENELHRRVQQRIAGQYLDHIEPEKASTDDPLRDRLQDFRSMDPDLKKKFDTQHRKYDKQESAYSVQNICWLIASLGVFYYTDFYLVVRYDHRINRLWFNLGAILVLVNITIAGFLIVWLSYVKKVHSDDWERLYPAAVPVATASAVLGAILLTVGLWPIWGLLTPVILFVMFMGFIVTVAMLPNAF